MVFNNWMIILIIGLIVFYLIYKSTKSIEKFNPYFNYSRTYPSNFTFNRNIDPYNKSLHIFQSRFSNKNQLSNPIHNSRYNSRYRDYVYIPKHEYLKNWMGLPQTNNFVRFSKEKGLKPHLWRRAIALRFP